MFSKDRRGFTIIETMIVLAIAGIILAAILLAINSLQVKARDNTRKAFAQQIHTRLLDFYNTNNLKYPACDASAPGYGCNGAHSTSLARFYTEHIGDLIDPDTGNPFRESTFDLSPSVLRTSTDSLTYFSDAAMVVHTRIPSVDQVLIYSGHWCRYSRPNGAPDSHPIGGHSVPGADLQLNKFAVIIGTERNGFYCIDNH